MVGQIMPRYPIYVPSKGRPDRCLTAEFLIRDNVPFYLVVEPQEREQYIRYGEDHLLILPWSDLGVTGLIAVRNWIKRHATAAGHLRHWQLDDNIRLIYRRWRAKRLPCNAGLALAAVEDFVDRYENIAIAGLNYDMFVPDMIKKQPFSLNVHVYSCFLVLNSLSNKWRSAYNDDTDMCLQVLADGWCTVLINAFLIKKITTMAVKGGNTPIYQGDGRLKMARALERLWPGVVTVKRRFRRPQHIVKNAWQRFDTPLKLKPGVNLGGLAPNEYGMKLVQVKPEIKSKELRRLVQDHLDRTEGEIGE